MSMRIDFLDMEPPEIGGHRMHGKGWRLKSAVTQELLAIGAHTSGLEGCGGLGSRQWCGLVDSCLRIGRLIPGSAGGLFLQFLKTTGQRASVEVSHQIPFGSFQRVVLHVVI